MAQKLSKQERALRKEWALLKKEEEKLGKAAGRTKNPGWKGALEQKLPDKVYKGLEAAFCKGFSLVFQKGKVIIERSFDRQELLADHQIRDYAISVKGGSGELKAMRRGAMRADLVNMTLTSLEGVGLGALGIGLPDIVLFLGTLLKGIYETALNYGYDYEDKQEQLLILKMMEASLSTGQAWNLCNCSVEELMLREAAAIREEAIQDQIKKTAAVFAMDMLLLKFIQGLPVVGMVGGAANPLYYSKVMKYVQLKYHKRWLRERMRQLGLSGEAELL